MKIAIVHDTMWPYHQGGGERRYYEFAKRLAAAGHEVHMIGNAPAGDFRGGRWETDDGYAQHFIAPSYPLYDSRGKRTTGEALGFARAVTAAVKVEILPSVDIIDANNIP
ncbi:MAG: glycosyltransferase family 1 protein, partial [Dehalococcoidia bacterium]